MDSGLWQVWVMDEGMLGLSLPDRDQDGEMLSKALRVPIQCQEGPAGWQSRPQRHSSEMTGQPWSCELKTQAHGGRSLAMGQHPGSPSGALGVEGTHWLRP